MFLNVEKVQFIGKNYVEILFVLIIKIKVTRDGLNINLENIDKNISLV